MSTPLHPVYCALLLTLALSGCDAGEPPDAPAVAQRSQALSTADCPAGYRVIRGTEAAETLNGTSGNDCIIGLGGNDVINGLGGNDYIAGGNGNDTIFGGSGNDAIHGEAGDDSLNGDNGTDTIDGGDGNDLANGGAGQDTLLGGSGRDTLHGGDTEDILRGGPDDDVLHGDAANDQLFGDDGDDVLDGDANNDTQWGGNGDDVLYGDVGNDTLNGEAGDDALIGGAGTNTINGGSGTDACSGTSCERPPLTLSGCSANAQCAAHQRCIADFGLCLGCVADQDGDRTCDSKDGCPADPLKVAAGVCGCGVSEANSDGDSAPNCTDGCPNDPAKLAAGLCGCGVSDVNSDGDSAPDCTDGCPNDPAKLAVGSCGCGVSDANSDGDSAPDCTDGCPDDATKTAPGVCGCGIGDIDSDADGRLDCQDACALDPTKTAPGVCGCGTPDGDADGDGRADCIDLCPGFVDSADEDSDGIPDGCDVRTSCRADLLGGIGVHMGDLIIEDDTDPLAYQDVTCVTGSLLIGGAVASLHGLESLTGVAGMVSIYGSQLTSVDGLEGLSNVDGWVQIAWNPALVELDGLAALSRIGGSLWISDNPLLESVRGLSSLSSLAPEGLVVRDNARLPGCQVIELEQHTHVRCAYFGCTGNDGTGSCGELPADFACVPGASGPGVYDGEVYLSPSYPAPGLGGVTCITGNLTVDRVQLSTLTRLQKVGGYVRITSTTATSLAELSRLEEIGGALDIGNNAALTDISGLDRLTRLGTGSTGLGVWGNENLPACQVWALAARLGKSCQDGPYKTCRWNTGAGSCGDLPADFACVPGAQGPGVYDGDIFTDYDTNLREYGGIRCVTGGLNLGGSPDLSYFAGLREVGGNLSIYGTTLTDLTALSGLREVGGWLSFSGNEQLQTAAGLEQLTRVGESLQITGNPLLRELSALDRLTSIGSAWISNNEALPACYAWNLAARSGQPCQTPYGNSCRRNLGTGSCGSLPAGFQCVPGAIGPGVFDGDIVLDTLNEYGGLTCVTGNFWLDGWQTDRSALSGLQQIGGNFYAWNQPLSNLAGLESLTRVGGFMQVSSNWQLTSLAGLENLTSVGGPLDISYNPQLTNLAGLARLTSVGAAGTGDMPPLTIVNNEQLPMCEVFTVASRTHQSCATAPNLCYGNTGTGSCEPLPPDFVCAPGAVGPGVYDANVWMSDSQQAERLRGATCITGDLTIGGSVTDLSALSSLQRVGGNLRIEYSWLPDLDALSQLTSVGGSLSLESNSGLTNLAGLRNLTTLGASASVHYNDQLPACWLWDLQSRFPDRVSDSGNNGSGHCGTLPADFRCEPGAHGPGVWDHDATQWQLHFLTSATCITGNLSIASSALTDLIALERLQMVGGNVELVGNEQLTSVDGLENLTSIGGNLRIYYNLALGNLHGLASLSELGAESGGPRPLELLFNESLPACWGPTLEQQTGVVCGDASTPPNGCQGNNGSGTCAP